MPTKIYIDINSLTGYQLGILWAIATFEENDGGYMLFRHREKYFLEQIQPLCRSKIQTSHSQIGMQYRLKVYGFSIDELNEWGWTPRTADTRNVPPLSNYRDFLRAWIEIHSDIGYSAYPKRKDLQKIRFRIYGNHVMMTSISRILHEGVGVGLKKPQSCVNEGKTCSLYYQSATEIKKVLQYVEGEPCFNQFWDEAYEKIKNPVIPK